MKNWRLVNFCEFDKYAEKSYCAIHGVDKSLNLGDITKVDEKKIDDFTMMTWGFPCTDISVAGAQKGFLDENGNKTRSGMYYEGIRILREKKPTFSIIENVKNLTGKKFKKEFEMVLSDLEEAGYNNYYKVLNAKNFGVPQNRERVFIVSIRKDVDNGKFEFPEGFDSGYRVADFLEDCVDERYYLSQDKVEKLLKNMENNGKLDELRKAISERANQTIQLGNYGEKSGWNNPQCYRVYSDAGCSPTLNTCGGGGHEPKIMRMGSVSSSQDGVVINPDGIAPACTAGHNNTPKIICGMDQSFTNPKMIEYANCLTTKDHGVSSGGSTGTAVCCLGNINPSGRGMNGNVFDENGLAPTLTTNKGEGNKIAIRQATKKGYIECEIGGVADLSYPSSKTRRGRVQEGGKICPTITATETGVCRIEKVIAASRGRNPKNPSDRTVGAPTEQMLEVNTTDCSNTLTTVQKDNYVIENMLQFIRIRKLTPKECFRLMGFSDEDFEQAKNAGISSTQLYKQAGNSIVVDVLFYILLKLYSAMPYLFDDLKLGSFFSGIGAFECALNRLYTYINTGELFSRDFLVQRQNDVPNVCIDDTQGFDGIRLYDGTVPSLRASRSGQKVVIPDEKS